MTDNPQPPATDAKEAKLKSEMPQKPLDTSPGRKKVSPHLAVRTSRIAKFSTFRDEFLNALSLSDFGEEKIDSTSSDKKSAGAKEIERTGVYRVLRVVTFLRPIHRLMRECIRLTEEQKRIRQLSSKSGRAIKKLRNVQATLQRMQAGVEDVENRLKEIAALDLRELLYKVRKDLELIQADVSDLEKSHVARIHPQLRAKHDKTSPHQLKFELPRWKSLLPPYEYPLSSLKKRATQQWLVEKLYRVLRKRLKERDMKLSKATRYRVISALMDAGGLPHVAPDTIKEYFAEKRKSQAQAAINSQIT
jgi:hypothetical protein